MHSICETYAKDFQRCSNSTTLHACLLLSSNLLGHIVACELRWQLFCLFWSFDTCSTPCMLKDLLQH